MRALHFRPILILIGISSMLGCSMLGCNGEADEDDDTAAADDTSPSTTASGTTGDATGSPTNGSGGADATSSTGDSTSSATSSSGATGGVTSTSAAAGNGGMGGVASTGTESTGGAGGSDSSEMTTTGQSDQCYSPTQNPELSDTDGSMGCACSPDDAPVCAGGRRFECQDESWVRVDDSPCAEPASCAALVGQTYLSVDQLECGNSPEGTVYCSWTLSFDSSEFEWQHSDITETGDYSCDAGVLSGNVGGQMVEGELHDDGSLTWAGEVYQPES